MQAFQPMAGMIGAHTENPGVRSPFHFGRCCLCAGAAAGSSQEPVLVSSNWPSGQYGAQPPAWSTWPTGHAQLTAGVPTVATDSAAAIRAVAEPIAVAARRIRFEIGASWRFPTPVAQHRV
jgi:hypothetical protein